VRACVHSAGYGISLPTSHPLFLFFHLHHLISSDRHQAGCQVYSIPSALVVPPALESPCPLDLRRSISLSRPTLCALGPIGGSEVPYQTHSTTIREPASVQATFGTYHTLHLHCQFAAICSSLPCGSAEVCRPDLTSCNPRAMLSHPYHAIASAETAC